MENDIKSLANWDLFFYYGQNDLDTECRFDLFELLLDDRRSLYYNRRISAGINSYENNPNDINLQVQARYDIANAIAYRNTVVTNGADGTKDRRIAASQNSIGFDSKGGELNIKILYFLYANYETPRADSFQLVR